MKTHSLYSAALLVAAIAGFSPLQADPAVTPIGGITTITLLGGFGGHQFPPSHVTVSATESVTIVSGLPGDSPSGEWFKDDIPIPGATNPVLLIAFARSSDSGVYRYDSLEPHIPENGSQFLLLNVRPATNLVNLSTRAFAGSGDQTMICGFIIAGKTGNTNSSTILLRAVGPTLARFGVHGVLSEPKITIFSADGTPYTTDFHYPVGPDAPVLSREQYIQWATTTVGAFPLDPGARDAVDIRPFPPGAYTVQVTGVNGSTGNVLVEAYEVPKL